MFEVTAEGQQAAETYTAKGAALPPYMRDLRGMSYDAEGYITDCDGQRVHLHPSRTVFETTSRDAWQTGPAPTPVQGGPDRPAPPRPGRDGEPPVHPFPQQIGLICHPSGPPSVAKCHAAGYPDPQPGADGIPRMDYQPSSMAAQPGATFADDTSGCPLMSNARDHAAAGVRVQRLDYAQAASPGQPLPAGLAATSHAPFRTAPNSPGGRS